MPSYRGRGAGRRSTDPLLALLLVQLFQKVQDLPWKPPVTLVVMAANMLIHFRHALLPAELSALVPDINEGCLMPYAIIWDGQWARLLWSAFLHLDDMHLYYNMMSLLIKGVQLERRLGSSRFAFLLVELLVVSHGLMALVCSWMGETFPEYRFLSRGTCAAGFSAVLFALKYVLTHDQPGWSYPLSVGVPVPTKYMAWAELLLIHYLVPGSSFTGHLAGICAGMLHMHFTSRAAGWLWRTLRHIRQFRGQGQVPGGSRWYGRGVGRNTRRADGLPAAATPASRPRAHAAHASSVLYRAVGSAGGVLADGVLPVDGGPGLGGGDGGSSGLAGLAGGGGGAGTRAGPGAGAGTGAGARAGVGPGAGAGVAGGPGAGLSAGAGRRAGAAAAAAAEQRARAAMAADARRAADLQRGLPSSH